MWCNDRSCTHVQMWCSDNVEVWSVPSAIHSEVKIKFFTSQWLLLHFFKILHNFSCVLQYILHHILLLECQILQQIVQQFMLPYGRTKSYSRNSNCIQELMKCQHIHFCYYMQLSVFKGCAHFLITFLTLVNFSFQLIITVTHSFCIC